MFTLTRVIKEWNTRWGNVERLRVVQANDNPRYGNYAQIGFSRPAVSANDLLWRPHYEFLQRGARFDVCYHKEDFHRGILNYRRNEDLFYQRFASFVRRSEPRIIRVLRDIVPNIGEEEIIDRSRRKYFWLNITLPAVADTKLACDCMETLISATYQAFAERLGEPPMPEFAYIAGE